MSSVVISGDVSGSVTLQAPSAAGTTVLTLPATSGTVVTGPGGVTQVSAGGTGLSTATTGDLLIGSGTNTLTRLAIGSNGTYLSSNGTTATWAVVSGTPAGTIIQYAGTTAPTGYLLCPTSATTVSRTTYATLFAAIGTTWGAGDGSTTFNIPAFTADFAPVQASSNVGTTTTGSVIAHTHTTNAQRSTPSSAPAGGVGSIGFTPATIDSTGGTNNLAAGARVLFCIKF